MSTCNFTTEIDENKCIGDSLPIINANFTNLDTTACQLSSISGGLVNSMLNLGSQFSLDMFSLLNLLNIGGTTTITFLNPVVEVFNKSMSQAGISCKGGTYTTTIVLPNSIPSTANFIFFRADIGDWSYFSTPNAYSYVSVNNQNVPTTYAPPSNTQDPYATIAKYPSYTLTWFVKNNTMGSSWDFCNKPLSVKIIGYY